MSELLVSSEAHQQEVSGQPGEVTWIDRALLSNNTDLTLHRRPRCPGLRYVDHQWELFNKDADHSVYIAPYFDGEPRTFRNVRRQASRVMPVARSAYEPVPWVLEPGRWLISVGQWVVRLTLTTAADLAGGQDGDTLTRSSHGPTTQMRPQAPPGEGGPAKLGGPPLPDALQRTRDYFARHEIVLLAIAYYYRDFILNRYGRESGVPIDPQTMPIVEVAVDLNLPSDSSVSEYKKELQRCIWGTTGGHQRELAEYLLNHGLISPIELDRAQDLARRNVESGLAEQARQRFSYKPRR
jgi:hypothetical protein